MILAPAGLEYLPFQQEGVDWLISHPRALLADEMGTGKTIQVCGLINATDPETVLVVCPASAKDHWKRELEKWVLLCPRIGVLYGHKLTKGKFIIVNYDILHLHQKALRSRHWDLVVIDEGHYVKDITSRRTKQTLGSSTLAPIRSNRAVVLTGTPIVNRPIEIYPVLRYLDGPNWSDYHAFGNQYCGGPGGVIIHHFGSVELYDAWKRWCWAKGLPDSNVVQDARQWREFKRSHYTRDVRLTLLDDYQGATNLPELRERLKSIMLRRTKAEVFPDLPPKQRRVICMDSRLRRWQEQPLNMEFASALLSLERGTIYEEEELATLRRETAERNLPVKLDYLESVLREEDKVVIFVHHKESVKMLERRFGGMSCTVCGSTPQRQRQQIVDDFQSDPSIRLFIGTKAAAEIYTLAAARRVLIAEPFWVPGTVRQMEDRLHRYPQREEVLVDYLAEEGTLDVVMAHAIVAKQNVIDRLLN